MIKKEKTITAQDIDALLPQTQCGLCGFKGCQPYANALAMGLAEINLCPPGGVTGLKRLATALKRDPTPFIPDMQKKEKKQTYRAVIREAECIGCTKCIQACPVDAILGSAKNMHSIIQKECTGCELCVPVCPTDCIDLIASAEPPSLTRAPHFRARFLAREKRLSIQKNLEKINNAKIRKITAIDDKKKYISEALARVKEKNKL